MNVKQIQKLDRMAMDRLGIPSCVLMENAGRAVAQDILRTSRTRSCMIGVICGFGNNAGDGFVAARYLDDAGIRVKVFLLAPLKKLKTDPAVYGCVLKRLKIPMMDISRNQKCFFQEIRKSDIIVDAIFGVGLNRPIEGLTKTVIRRVNAMQKPVVAVDVPSGLDGTSGKIYDACLKAKTTVTFSAAKQGFYRDQGPYYAGRIVVADIGIPKKLIKSIR